MSRRLSRSSCLERSLPSLVTPYQYKSSNILACLALLALFTTVPRGDTNDSLAPSSRTALAASFCSFLSCSTMLAYCPLSKAPPPSGGTSPSAMRLAASVLNPNLDPTFMPRPLDPRPRHPPPPPPPPVGGLPDARPHRLDRFRVPGVPVTALESAVAGCPPPSPPVPVPVPVPPHPFLLLLLLLDVSISTALRARDDYPERRALRRFPSAEARALPPPAPAVRRYTVSTASRTSSCSSAAARPTTTAWALPPPNRGPATASFVSDADDCIDCVSPSECVPWSDRPNPDAGTDMEGST